jgi:hypothetical protein
MPLNSKSTVPDEHEIPEQKINRRRAEENVRAHKRAIVGPMATMLWSIARVTQAFHVVFGDISDNDRCKIFAPKRLVMAWPHLVLALAQSSQEDDFW